MEAQPFAYPLAPHVRKHGPRGYHGYESYREWLRDEFNFRCVLCLFREQWPGAQAFEIDHLLPRAKYPEKEYDYNNLLYLSLPSHREQSNVGLCASFMAELGGLSYMKE